MFSRMFSRRARKSIHRQNRSARRSASQITFGGVETLESRTLFSTVTTLSTLTLPAANTTWSGFTESSPVLADLNGDGKQEIIAVCNDGVVRAYKYDSTQPNNLALFATYSSGETAEIHDTPVVVNLPVSGPTVWFGNDNNDVFGFLANGTPFAPAFHVPTPFGDVPATGEIRASLTSADVNGTGTPDIIVNSTSLELSALKINETTHTISVDWQLNNDDTSISSPAVGDINGSLTPSIVVGGDSSYTTYQTLGGVTTSFYWSGGRVKSISANGKIEWMYRTDQIIASSPALADLTGSGNLDTIVGTGYFYPQPNVAPYPGNKVYALDQNGTPIWTYTTEPPNVDGRVYASPAIGDINGDGTLDAVVVDGAGNVDAINGKNGTALWTFPILAGHNAYSSPVIADWNGDGIQDVVVVDGPYLRVLSGADGSVIYSQNFDAQLFNNSVAIGHFKDSTSWQAVMISNGSNSSLSVYLSASTMTVLDLGNSTTNAPDWPQFRHDESHHALKRNATFVTNIITTAFNAFYKRDPTTSELTTLIPVFTDAVTLILPIGALVGSDQSRAAEITDWYKTYIGRTPAQAEITSWIGSLGAGTTFSVAQASFVASPEFYALSGGTTALWITAIYQNLLGRAPEAGAVDAWTAKLGDNSFGNRRDNVAINFFLSPEKTAKRVTDLFATYHPFGITTPSQAQIETAGYVLRSGGREEYVYVEILASFGHFDFYNAVSSIVNGYYQDIYGRAPTDAELANSIAFIEGSGGNFAALANSMITSTEGRTRTINIVYNQYLDRSATSTEITAELAALNSGSTFDSLVKTLVSSDEFFTKSGGTNTGFITQAYYRMVARDPAADGELTTWLNFAASSNPGLNNIRVNLPTGLLKDSSFFYHMTDLTCFHYLRRLNETPVDNTRIIAPGSVNREAALIAAWQGGGSYENVILGMVTSSEYFGIWTYKGIWQGDHWLS